MAKKERLGSDPFKESPLNWIQDTREEKKEPKEEIKKQKPQNVKASKRLDVKTLKRQSVKAPKSLNVKTSIKDKVKKTERKKRHTIYLSISQSKKLKVHAAEHDMQLSEIIEKLINDNI